MNDSIQPTPVTLAELEEWASKNEMEVSRRRDGYVVRCTSCYPLNPPTCVVEDRRGDEHLIPIIYILRVVRMD